MKKKRTITIIISCLTLAVLLLLALNAAIAASPGEGGGCIAVVFDKAAVMGADRIVVYLHDDTVTITDKSLVHEIASEFVVANRTGLCDERSGEKMEIYNGDRLVRTVYWSGCVDNLAEIYRSDALHWIFPNEGREMAGQLELSPAAYERIMEIIASQRAN